jgi:hypothetical protein
LIEYSNERIGKVTGRWLKKKLRVGSKGQDEVNGESDCVKLKVNQGLEHSVIKFDLKSSISFLSATESF